MTATATPNLNKLSGPQLVAVYRAITGLDVRKFSDRSTGLNRIRGAMNESKLSEAAAFKAAGIEMPEPAPEDVTPLPELDAFFQNGGKVAKLPAAVARGANGGRRPNKARVLVPTKAEPVAEPKAKAPKVAKVAAAKTEPVAVTSSKAIPVATAPARYPDAEVDAYVLGAIENAGKDGCKVGPVRAAWIVAARDFKSLAPTQQKGIIRRSVRRLEAVKLIAKDGQIFRSAK